MPTHTTIGYHHTSWSDSGLAAISDHTEASVLMSALGTLTQVAQLRQRDWLHLKLCGIQRKSQ